MLYVILFNNIMIQDQGPRPSVSTRSLGKSQTIGKENRF